MTPLKQRAIGYDPSETVLLVMTLLKQCAIGYDPPETACYWL